MNSLWILIITAYLACSEVYNYKFNENPLYRKQVANETAMRSWISDIFADSYLRNVKPRTIFDYIEGLGRYIKTEEWSSLCPNIMAHIAFGNIRKAQKFCNVVGAGSMMELELKKYAKKLSASTEDEVVTTIMNDYVPKIIDLITKNGQKLDNPDSASLDDSDINWRVDDDSRDSQDNQDDQGSD